MRKKGNESLLGSRWAAQGLYQVEPVLVSKRHFQLLRKVSHKLLGVASDNIYEDFMQLFVLFRYMIVCVAQTGLDRGGRDVRLQALLA